MPFEPDNAPFLSGTIKTIILDSDALNPQNIIMTSTHWHVRVEWSLKGLFVPMLSGSPANWHIAVFLDPLGLGTGLQPIPAVDVPVGPVSGLLLSYNKTVTIPATANPKPGPYQLTTVLTLTHGNAPLPIAAYDEGPVLQFYQFP